MHKNEVDFIPEGVKGDDIKQKLIDNFTFTKKKMMQLERKWQYQRYEKIV